MRDSNDLNDDSVTVRLRDGTTRKLTRTAVFNLETEEGKQLFHRAVSDTWEEEYWRGYKDALNDDRRVLLIELLLLILWISTVFLLPGR